MPDHDQRPDPQDPRTHARAYLQEVGRGYAEVLRQLPLDDLPPDQVRNMLEGHERATGPAHQVTARGLSVALHEITDEQVVWRGRGSTGGPVVTTRQELVEALGDPQPRPLPMTSTPESRAAGRQQMNLEAARSDTQEEIGRLLEDYIEQVTERHYPRTNPHVLGRSHLTTMHTPWEDREAAGPGTRPTGAVQNEPIEHLTSALRARAVGPRDLERNARREALTHHRLTDLPAAELDRALTDHLFAVRGEPRRTAGVVLHELTADQATFSTIGLDHQLTTLQGPVTSPVTVTRQNMLSVLEGHALSQGPEATEHPMHPRQWTEQVVQAQQNFLTSGYDVAFITTPGRDTDGSPAVRRIYDHPEAWIPDLETDLDQDWNPPMTTHEIPPLDQLTHQELTELLGSTLDTQNLAMGGYHLEELLVHEIDDEQITFSAIESGSGFHGSLVSTQQTTRSDIQEWNRLWEEDLDAAIALIDEYSADSVLIDGHPDPRPEWTQGAQDMLRQWEVERDSGQDHTAGTTGTTPTESSQELLAELRSTNPPQGTQTTNLRDEAEVAQPTSPSTPARQPSQASQAPQIEPEYDPF